MVSEKLKSIIFNRLYSELSHVEIIHFRGDYIWFIDRDEKYWYFRYDKSDGRLLWRYDFFSSFFSLFTIDRDVFELLLSSWVEEVLNYKVITPQPTNQNPSPQVEEVLNYKVITPQLCGVHNTHVVEEVLNYKVITPEQGWCISFSKVEEVLNYKVNSIGEMNNPRTSMVDTVLSHKVNITEPVLIMGPSLGEVLNNTTE